VVGVHDMNAVRRVGEGSSQRGIVFSEEALWAEARIQVRLKERVMPNVYPVAAQYPRKSPPPSGVQLALYAKRSDNANPFALDHTATGQPRWPQPPRITHHSADKFAMTATHFATIQLQFYLPSNLLTTWHRSTNFFSVCHKHPEVQLVLLNPSKTVSLGSAATKNVSFSSSSAVYTTQAREHESR